jgi:hypothetical protein
MEQSGQGSDPHALEQAGDLRCAHCRAVIVNDRTMIGRGGQVYCCQNCASAMGANSASR